MRLSGRVAIVTGGAQGIGAAIVKRFAREGAAVLIVDLLADRAAAMADEVQLDGGRAQAFICDLVDASAIERIVPTAVDAFGDVDVCVNCAGVARIVDFTALERTEFERVLSINLTAPFQLGQACARHMIAKGTAARSST